MNKSYENICLLLALSGLNQREMKDALSVALKKPEKFLDDIIFIRKSINKNKYNYINNHTELNLFDNLSNKYIEDSSNYEIVQKIDKLLRHEAKLTVSDAVQVIINYCSENHPTIKLPVFNRQSFSAWIHELMKILPESELLHIATIIRNKSVHSGNDFDWKLK